MKTRENILNLFRTLLDREPGEEELRYHMRGEKTFEEKKEEFLACSEYKMLQYMKNLKPDTTDFTDVEELVKNKQLKVALCLSGFVRNYHKVYPTILNNIVNVLNADVFFHTWDNHGYQKIDRSEFSNTWRPVPDPMSNVLDVNALVSVIKPKKYLVENNQEIINTFDFKRYEGLFVYYHQAKPQFIQSQMYSIYKSNELKKLYEEENGFTYDIVIKLRFDYSIYSPIPLIEIKKCLNESKTIIVPSPPFSNHDHPPCELCQASHHEGPHNSDVCDVFAFSSSANMDYYASIFKSGLDLMDQQRETNQVRLFEKRVYHTKESTYTMIHHLDDINNNVCCYYPEKTFRLHLEGYRVFGSKLRGAVTRI